MIPRLALSLSLVLALGCAGSGQTGSPGGGGGGAGGGAAGSGGGAGAQAGGGGSAGGNAGGSGGGAGGTAGGGAGSGGSAGPCGGFALCDDFEGPAAGQTPDPQKWTVDLVSSSGTVTIDTAQHHGGTKALHVDGKSGFHTMAMAKGAPVFPLPTGVLFGRAYVMGPSAPNGHVIWIEAGSVTNDVAETRIGSNLGQLDINAWPGDWEQRAPAAHLSGAWQCLEFMFDSTADEARVWLDGTELTDLHVTNWVAPNPQNGNHTMAESNWAPDYQAVRFGWELNGGSIWFDDVVLGYSRIGCQ